MKKKIIVITAHPDDAEIGMGMRISKYVSEMDEVILVVATAGEYGENQKSRYEENNKAAKILGISKKYFLGYECGALNDVTNQLRKELEKIIKFEKPDIAYTLFPYDIHIDHEVVSKQATIAARSIPTLIYFRVVNSQKFLPNAFFFGDKELFGKKIESIECYKNEVNRKGAVNLDLLKLNSASEYYHHYHHSSIKTIKNNIGIRDEENLYCEMFYIERLSYS